MARGSVFKRCQCRDGQGRKLQACKRSHGSWGFVVDSGEDPNTGRRKQVKRGGFQTKSDAQAAMTAALNDLHRGTWVDDHAISLGEWLDNWLAENSGRRSVKTMANYRGHVRDVWRPQLGHLKLRELRRVHIEAVLRGLAEEIAPESRGQGNVGRPVRRRSSTTIEGYRRTLRAALSAARRRGLISTNPAEGRIDAIEAPTAHTISIWEPEQTAAFLEHVRADRYAALYELAAYAGLRRAELCGLRWIDIDGDGRGLTVRQSIVELAGKDIDADLRRCPHCGTEHRGLLAKGPKSAAGVRWVPLVAPARAALEARRQEYLTQREACGAGYVDHGFGLLQPGRHADPARLGHDSVRASCDPVRSAEDSSPRPAARGLLDAACRRSAHRTRADDPWPQFTDSDQEGLRPRHARGDCGPGREGISTPRQIPA